MHRDPNNNGSNFSAESARTALSDYNEKSQQGEVNKIEAMSLLNQITSDLSGVNDSIYSKDMLDDMGGMCWPRKRGTNKDLLDGETVSIQRHIRSMDRRD